MNGGVEARLIAIAIVLFFTVLFMVVFLGIQPEKVSARANLTAYLTAPPSSWEPSGYNLTGTATKFVVDALGWNATKIEGNIGIGNGSIATLNNASNLKVNYTDNDFMAADISMAPWNPSRLTNVSEAQGANEANNTTSVQKNNSTTGNRSLTSLALDNVDNMTSTADTQSSASSNGGVEKANNTTPNVISNIGYNVPLNDAYHPILMGRPVDDLLYEYPILDSANLYARLIGLRMPYGGYENIGIKCLGVGY